MIVIYTCGLYVLFGATSAGPHAELGANIIG